MICPATYLGREKMSVLLAILDPTKIHTAISFKPISLKDACVRVSLDGSHCTFNLLFENYFLL